MQNLLSRHRLWQLLVDGAIVALSWWLAFQLRFDHGPPIYYQHLLSQTILLVVAIKLIVFIAFGFYNRWWRYVSIRDMWATVRGVVVACLIADVTVYLVSPVHGVRLPRSIAATDLLLTLAFVAGSRLLARTVVERPGLNVVARGKEVVVVGAGRRAGDRSGDAALTDAQLHADRLRRRRSAQTPHEDHGRPGTRRDRRAAAHPARAPAR